MRVCLGLGAEEALAMRLALLLVCAIIAGCAEQPPTGEDELGIAYKATAVKVLAAVEQFHKERGRYPNSPYELVPHYLPQLPDEPGFHINGYTGTVDFTYSRAWPHSARVSCSAKLGTSDWICRE